MWPMSCSSAYFSDEKICSTTRAAQFFGLVAETGTGSGSDPGGGNGGGSDTGNAQSGGCNTGHSAGLGVGFGLIALRRRRR